MRLDEKMAQRLQGEEDEHASKLREARRKNKELKAAQEANRLQMEKYKEQEKARAEAAEKERLEKQRQKDEAKRNKQGFFSSGSTGASTQQAKTKRAPFNFEAVGLAHLRYDLAEQLCNTGKAKNLAGSGYSFDACKRSSQCFAARQSREGIRCKQCSSTRPAQQAEGLA